MPTNLEISPLQKFVEEAKAEIANGNLKAAQAKIAIFFKNSPHFNDVIQQQARLSALAHQIRNGIISFEDKIITTNQITSATLKVLDFLSEQEISEPIVEKEIIRAIEHCKNVVIDSTINAGNVTIGDTIINNYYQNSSEKTFSNLENDLLIQQKNILKRFLVTEEDPTYIQLPKQTRIKETLSFNVNVQQSSKDLSNVGIEKIFFDECLASMLILGAPGSGKTTLLAELGYKIAQRSLETGKGYLPLLFNLTSWSIFKVQKKSGSFKDWLAYEAKNSIGLIKKDIEKLIVSKKIICLFDGLDEVAEDDRLSCLQAFNQFMYECRCKVVITCRRNEYNLLKKSSKNPGFENVLRIEGAVEILPLSNPQLSSFLENKKLNSILKIYQKSDTLMQVLNSPLWLSITVNTYKKYKWEEIETEPQNWKYHLMSYYEDWIVNTKLKELNDKQSIVKNKKKYDKENVKNWIAWLAFIMNRQQISVLYLERVQPWFLPNSIIKKYNAQTNIILGLCIGIIISITYSLAFGLKNGFLTGLSVGLVYQYISPLQRLFSKTIFRNIAYILASSVSMGMIAFFVQIHTYSFFGAFVLALTGLLIDKDYNNEKITLTESFNFNLRSFSIDFLIFSFVYSIGYSIAYSIPIFLIIFFFDNLSEYISSKEYIAVIVIVGLLGGLLEGLSSGLKANSYLLEQFDKPYQGFKNNLTYILSAFFPGLIVLSISLLLVRETFFIKYLDLTLTQFLAIIGALLMLIIPEKVGGISYLKHLCLKRLLSKENYISKNYIEFLNTACRIGYLKRIGGGYSFFHREFQDYLDLKYGDRFKDQYTKDTY